MFLALPIKAQRKPFQGRETWHLICRTPVAEIGMEYIKIIWGLIGSRKKMKRKKICLQDLGKVKLEKLGENNNNNKKKKI